MLNCIGGSPAVVDNRPMRPVTPLAAHLVIVLLPILVGGCASLPLACLPPSRPMVSAEILFGRDIGDRVGVSEAEFAAFIAAEGTPRFPDGLTVIDTHGQWRDERRGVIIREPGKLVKIVFADDALKRQGIAEVAAAYRRKFRQQSVLTSLQASCVRF